MKTHLKSIVFCLVSCVLSLAFTACNDSNSSPTGPSSGSSFSGSSITFNPTVNFTTGSALTYLNTVVGSPFPAATTATAGTYTYVPNATFTTGTLTLTVSGITDPIVLEISNFVHSGTNITSFTAKSGGQNYPVTVTGTLPAHKPAPAAGGGGNTNESAAPDIPTAVQGTYTLNFVNAFGGNKISGSPHDTGDTVTFVIDARTLKVGSKTLSNPVSTSASQEVYFKDGSITYAVSQNNLGAFNEINVGGPLSANGVPSTFYGQFSDEPIAPVLTTPEGNASTGGTYSGTITLASVGLNGRGPSAPNLLSGSRIGFTLSEDRLTVTVPTLDGKPARTLTFDPTASSTNSNAYSDKTSAPTNHLTVSLSLHATTGLATSAQFDYVENTVSNTGVHTTTYVSSNIAKP